MNPKDIMYNIEKITEHLKNKGSTLQTIELIKNKNNSYLTVLEKTQKKYYRCYKYIESDSEIGHDIYYECGLIVGNFINELADFNPFLLRETIPNFHNPKKRYEYFLKVYEENRYLRKKFCLIECGIIIKNNHIFRNMCNLIEKRIIPVRVVHNDTKTNNILFRNKKAIAIIDLDTVMPGSLLYDFGDSIRSIISNLAEDDRNISKMTLKFDAFEKYTTGFLESTIDIIKQEEINLLVEASIVITYECGMRFLTDFLENDNYFKTKYCNHNLIRAKNQLQLFTLLKDNEKKLKSILQKCVVQVYKKTSITG